MSSFIFMGFVFGFIVWKLINKATKTKSGSNGSRLNPESKYIILFDDDRIAVTYPNGQTHSIRWSELSMVGIRTTDEGPWFPDVFWGLHGVDKKPAVVYPQGATGEQGLLEIMQKRLPEFNNEKLIQAMGCTSNAFFLIWEISSGGSETSVDMPRKFQVQSKTVAPV